jgi:membrane protease YdiL (CAAX protease family)
VGPLDPGEDRDDAVLPTGPHPTIGPSTVRMPSWPGPVLAIGGALLAVIALGAGSLALDGQLGGVDPVVLAWLTIAGALAFTVGLLYSAVRQLRVRRYLAPERYRGPSVLLLLALVLVLASVFTAPFGADAAALLLGSGELTLLGSIVLLISTQAALLLVSWLLVFRPNALAALPRLPGPDPARAVRMGLGWGVVAWIGASVLSAVVVALLDALGVEVEPQAAEQALGLVEPWVAVLAIVVLAPIAEEVFFRGVVFNAFLRERGPRMAYVGSAAMFAVIHLSVVALLPIFLLGLALAWVYDRTGNLIAPIVMHAVVNGISVAIALLVRFDVITLPV